MTIRNWRSGQVICTVEAKTLEGVDLGGGVLEHADLMHAVLRGAIL